MNLRKFIHTALVSLMSENKLYDKLSKDNKYTLPKIPARNVFLNQVQDMTSMSHIRREADKYFENDKYKELPVEYVDINSIVPTQKNITIGNLESTNDIGNDTEAYLVKYKGYYYILDGHHRIANRILKGDNKIKAYVYAQN